MTTIDKFPMARRRRIAAWAVAVLAAVFGVMLSPPEAGAGWRYTEWAVTERQVIAASNGTAKPYPVALRRTWGDYPNLRAPYRAFNQSFEAWFYFDRYSGGLSAVRLVPTGRYWCNDVWRSLMARYGAGPRIIGEDLIWTDPANNNQITVIGYRGCSIKFAPLGGAGHGN